MDKPPDSVLCYITLLWRHIMESNTHLHYMTYVARLTWLVILRILKFAEICKGLCKIYSVFHLILPLYKRSESEVGLTH
jgi:hypothetical protein